MKRSFSIASALMFTMTAAQGVASDEFMTDEFFTDPADPMISEDITASASDESCMLPVTQLKWKAEWMVNPKAKQEWQGRYLVADLNMKDESGRCKGVEEVLPEPQLRAGYNMGAAMSIAPDNQGCAGQSLSLCEKDGETVRLVAKFALSAIGKKYLTNYAGYYAPVNVIRTRHGDGRASTAQSRANDALKGGGDEKLLKYQGVSPMYNFMNFVPFGSLKGETQNGLHRYPDGQKHVLGSPASHGCMRLSGNGSRFVRDWTPIGAKFFIVHPTVKFVTK